MVAILVGTEGCQLQRTRSQLLLSGAGFSCFDRDVLAYLYLTTGFGAE